MYATKFLWLPMAAITAAGLLLIAAIRYSPTQTAVPAASNTSKRSVVVELFTSEGCSSCPPADELLGHLRQQPNANGAEVIPLGFHVDYWDHLGWRDQFDSPEFTKRQQDYANRFQLEGPYTPQMVVNGAAEFVGSSADRASHAIQEAGSQPEAASVVLSSTKKGELAIQVSGATQGDVMLAITEDNLATKVGGGENGGRTLHHSAVVRDFRRVGQMKDGAFTVSTPLRISNDWKRNDLRAVVFIQDPASGRILGGSSRPLNSLVASN
jgi:hypothetical protein